MEYSKWTKQASGPLPFIIVFVMTVIVIALAILLGSRGLYQNGLTQLLVSVVALGGLALAYKLSKRNANVMSRVLKIAYESVEFSLRKVFKNKNIRFNREEDEARHRIFEILGTGLTITIRPYDPIHGSSGLQRNVSSIGMPLSATLVTLQGVSATNRDMVDILVKAIDGIDSQESNNENTA